MCKHRVDQHLTVLKLYSISIDKILVTELMTLKVLEKLNSIQKMTTQGKQQLNRYMFSKVIECLEKPNT